MEMDISLYWIIAIAMLVVGFFLFSKSFFYDNKKTINEIEAQEDGIPIVARDKRENYLSDIHDLSLSDDLDELSSIEIQADNKALPELQTSVNDISEITTKKFENEHVDALGSTLSSLEHATADIMPVVDKSSPNEFEGKSNLLDEHLQDQEKIDQIGILEEAEEVVSITLLPNSSINFDGQAVMEILDAYGLKFGEMNLYHRYVNPKGTGTLLFSVMRYTADDSLPFDIQTLSDETVDGLTFFMPLPHPKPVEAIGGMLSLAGSIGRDLNGIVHNDNFKPLTSQDKDELKEYVQRYGR